MAEVENLKKEINDSNQINEYLKNENKKLLLEISELKESNKKMTEKLNEITTSKQNLRIENEKLKNELKSLKSAKLEDNFDAKLNSIYEFIEKEKIKQKKEEDERQKLDLIHEESKKQDLAKIAKWINPKQLYNFDLIFKKTRDGDTAKIFHELCDNKGATVTIIETTVGLRFGGFRNDSWDCKGWKRNSYDFLFSLDFNKVYNIKDKTKDSAFGHIDRGPCFGNDAFYGDLVFHKTLNFGRCGNNIYETNREPNGGKNLFKTKEIEVYAVHVISSPLRSTTESSYA